MRISRLTKPGPFKKKSEKPVICISMGYPAGIGPEIIVKTLAKPSIRRLASFLIIGDRHVLDRAMALTGIKIKLSAKGINLYDLKNVEPKNFSFGKISGSYGRAS
ncbi:MAG: hypothetical protein HQ572_03075, partial [Candidatus Omnitrophica bacterium]|nr:hypothetical protein [Candidatus Omnitrophota bacterium]